MTASVETERRLTLWDVIFGLILVAAGIFLLANSFFASALTVWIIAWTSLVAGIVQLVGAFFRLKSGKFWSHALGGVVLIVLGVYILRNPVIGAVALTLTAGALFFASGLVRIILAFQTSSGRGVLIFSGAISVVLGLYVLFNPIAATMVLLGTILGVQAIVEGVTLVALGRERPVRSAS